jgi:predicted neuraminidase
MFIFEKDKYFKECHAVSAIRLDNGDCIATWFGGSHEGKDDVDIWGARLHNKKWSKPEKLISDELPLWNPVLFYDSGLIALFFRRGGDIGGWRSYVMYSKDNGMTYGEPQILPDGFMGPIKNKPIKMSNGEWLCGSSLEPEWDSIIEIYSPKSDSWISKSVLSVPDTPVNSGIIQPTLWESKPGKVHAIMRSSLGKLFRADSNDYGRTWNAPYPIDLPSNNSGVDLAKLPGGELVLAYNPIAENWGKRSPLILSMSVDNGKTWPFHYTLEEEEEQNKENRYAGRYSYPAVIAVPEGVACFYTHCRNRIKYQIVSPEQIKNGSEHSTKLFCTCAG